MGLLPIPAPRLTQGASRAGFWRVTKADKSDSSVACRPRSEPMICGACVQ